MEAACFETGVIRACDNNMHHFTMRLLDHTDYTQIKSLCDSVQTNLKDRDLLLPTPDDILKKGVSEKGFTCGTLVGGKLIGLRSVYFPSRSEKNNIGLDAGISGKSLDKIIELKLSLVDERFRGNSLQKRMTTYLLEMLSADGAYDYCCAIVSPKNIPSMIDKFSQQMKLVRLVLKNEIYWRCLFVKDMRQPRTPWYKSLFHACNKDIVTQLSLLKDGYLGLGISRRYAGGCDIIYAR